MKLSLFWNFSVFQPLYKAVNSVAIHSQRMSVLTAAALTLLVSEVRWGPRSGLPLSTLGGSTLQANDFIRLPFNVCARDSRIPSAAKLTRWYRNCREIWPYVQMDIACRKTSHQQLQISPDPPTESCIHIWLDQILTTRPPNVLKNTCLWLISAKLPPKLVFKVA